jgi:translation initiation factor IF-2
MESMIAKQENLPVNADRFCVSKASEPRSTSRWMKLEDVLAIGDFKELNVIVKGDVDGSVEALV